jgi:hypothetical protein
MLSRALGVPVKSEQIISVGKGEKKRDHLRLVEFARMHGWRRVNPSRAICFRTVLPKQQQLGGRKIRVRRGERRKNTNVFFDEIPYPRLDSTIQLHMLACCAWVRRECVC